MGYKTDPSDQVLRTPAEFRSNPALTHMLPSTEDSDTESEHMDIKIGAVADSLGFVAGLQTLNQELPTDAADVAQAVELIESISVQGIKDGFLDEVHGSASTIVNFLQNLTDRRNGYDSANFQQVFCSMLRPSFISHLFEHRQTSYSLTARANGKSPCSIFISWVDVVLAKLGEAILLISGRGSYDFSRSYQLTDEEMAMLGFWNSRNQKEQAIRVASQLPETWQETIAILGSDRVSEAARRLAISLMFGAYVLRSDLSADSDQISRKVVFDVDLLQTALHAYLSRISRESCGDESQTCPTVSSLHADTIRESQYSMIISLFAEMELSRVRNVSEPQIPFRPSTISILFTIVEGLMTESPTRPNDPCSNQPPTLRDNLNQNQRRMLRWGVTVPWCWMVWGNDSSAYLETVIWITATWLCNFASVESDIEKVLHFSPIAAMTVLLARKSITPSDLGERSVLYKACWVVFYLAQHYYHKIADNFMMEACQRFFLLIPSPQFSGIDISIREVAVEFLAFMPNRQVKAALDSSYQLEGTSVRVIIREAMEYLMCSGPSIGPVRGDSIKRTKVSLDLLILVASSGASAGSMMTDKPAFVSHISSILRNDSDWPKSTKQSALLLLGYIKGLNPGDKDIDRISDLVCISAISQGSKELVMAAAFALYIHCTAKPGFVDPITLSEAWDYLRDVLLLTLRDRHFFEKLDPLAVLLPASICSALTSLLACMRQNTAVMLLNSPWTMTLYKELRASCETVTHSTLKSGYPTYACTLLGQIEQLSAINSLSSPQPCIPARLVVHRSGDDYCLVALAVE